MMQPLKPLVVGLALIAAACSAGEDTATTTATAITTTTVAQTTSPAPDTTTTTVAAPTTTTATTTSTTTPAAVVVDATAVVGVLQPYSPGGGDLFPAGSVEAHWYRWDNFYVVLYRGFDAETGDEICAGTSILVAGLGFNDATNSPYLGTADAICVDAEEILEEPEGVQVCGPLLYYLTAIPIDKEGTLYGTLEIGLGGGAWEGQTSQAIARADVPPFEPGQDGYALPASGIDDLGVVSCGA